MSTVRAALLQLARSRPLPWISLFATLALGAHAEITIGELIKLGPFAYFIPAAIDVYAVEAYASGRDIGWATSVLLVAFGGGHAYIGWTSVPAGRPLTAHVVPAALGAGVGVILVAVLARVESLSKGRRADAASARAAELEQELDELRAKAIEGADQLGRELANVRGQLDRALAAASRTPPPLVETPKPRKAPRPPEGVELSEEDREFLPAATRAAARVVESGTALTRDGLLEAMREDGAGTSAARVGLLLKAIRLGVSA